MRVLLLVALLATFLTGCQWRDDQAWPPREAPTATAVVFAPVALGPLERINPQARTAWPGDLAARMLIGTRSAAGYAAPGWPASDDIAWEHGLPADAGALGYVVLTRIVSIETAPDAAIGPRLRATATMRVLDRQGRQVWSKTARVDSPVQDLGKLPGPEAKPESRAAWAACSGALSALGDWLAARDDHPAGAVPAAEPAPVPLLAAGEVRVAIGSQPDHADVLVDGALRGTTPCMLALPGGKPVRLRLERAGCQPWERSVTPTESLSLAPALAPAAP